ncbi:amino acid hydroxymethyltransferase [uncultured Clostridium sp.]|uniref:amino acid hydroxymethyltransferase n=1 Tax=uncultured Clostridium sp. TaxID=59620 RepID=UPI00272E0B3D|nr:amino acid hydroxymethyltransferase [uncultured Clostridium sp.]
MNIEEKFKEIKYAIEQFNEYHNNTIPLCAAENIISPFCKIPLDGNYQERYIMGSPSNYIIDNNFVGSQYLLTFYNLIDNHCKQLFEANYVDSKTLSGMNCVSTLLMALTNYGDKILLLEEDAGGHPSVIEICKRLGLQIKYVPFDYENYTINYIKLNNLINNEKPKYICLAPSDIIIPYDIEKIDLSDTTLLYDASQILGLIAGKVIANPLNTHTNNIVLFGGTHKTLPGPTHGLIMTNSKEIFEKLENTISPKFIRNTQMNQIISLLFTLVEFEEYGTKYMNCIVKNANTLGKLLEYNNFNVVKINNEYSKTHQLFIKCQKNEMNNIYRNAILTGVTLNKKERKLFGGYGIRLGIQEISRYGWDYKDLKIIANVLAILNNDKFNINMVKAQLKLLSKKEIKFTYSKEIMDYFKP